MKDKLPALNLSSLDKPVPPLRDVSGHVSFFRESIANICYFALFPLTGYAFLFSYASVTGFASEMYSWCGTGRMSISIDTQFTCPFIFISSLILYYFASGTTHSPSIARILSVTSALISILTYSLVFGGISWLLRLLRS